MTTTAAADDGPLLKWIDAGGTPRGLHLDNGEGGPLCGRFPQSGISPDGRQGHYEPHVLVTGGRETLGEYRERIGHTVTICGHCLKKAES